MLLSNLIEVNKLAQVKEKLEKAMTATNTFWEDIDSVDCGGTPGFNTGYGAYLSRYSGGGDGVDLSGCYVGVQIAKATMRVLQLQHSLVGCRLEELNVILEEEK